jgi:hypothetical protein
MLFDLNVDEGEVKNVARQNPETHQTLYEEMMRYFEVVGARIPKGNPDYDPETYKADGDHGDRVRWGPFEGERPLEDDEI